MPCLEDDIYDGLGQSEKPESVPGTNLAPLRGVIDQNKILRTATAGAGGKLGSQVTTTMARPLTSVKGAGFQGRTGNRPEGRGLGPAVPLADRGELSLSDQAHELEGRVHILLEASAEASRKGDALLALERAKEAGRKERVLEKFIETSGLEASDNFSRSSELPFAVVFNLATAYTSAKQFSEALSTYTLLAKNKSFGSAAKLRVNMGNIYFEQAQFPAAIKQYRMAMDLLPQTSRDTRHRLQRNIGHAFVRMGSYSEAISAYESVMDAKPDLQAGFNLLLCYYALGNLELLRSGFSRLLSVPLPVVEDEDGDTERKDDTVMDSSGVLANIDASRDALHEEYADRQRAALGFVLAGAKLVAPVLDASNWVAGYDWVISQLSVDHRSIANEMAIARALGHLSRKNFAVAIEELKGFEKKGVAYQARAAVNLAFLYFLEGDLAQSGKYAAMAVKSDRYNARALVNMGNCLLEDRGDIDRAKELYLEAIGVEADCAEAIHNLGLVNKQTGALGEALQAFEKLHTLVPSSPEVLYQLSSLHEAAGNQDVAVKYLRYLASQVPNDPAVLARLGTMQKDNEGESFHYHAESYRVWPVDLEVLSWLGVWYVQAELYEKAVEFFERAAEVQPTEPKWKLMVASCYRRSGALGRAIEVYEDIHTVYPENVECLRYLVTLCKETRRRYDDYEVKLLKLDRASAFAQGNGAGDAILLAQRSGPSTEPLGAPTDNDAFAAPTMLPSAAVEVFEDGDRAQHGRQDDDFGDADIDDLLA